MSFRGVSLLQDSRFSDKQKTLLDKLDYPKCFSKKVDPKKLNLPLIKNWIEQKLLEVIGQKDDIVVNYVCELFSQKSMDPKSIQMNITAFLGEKARPFMKDFWKLLLDCQKSEKGFPLELIPKPKEEEKKPPTQQNQQSSSNHQQRYSNDHQNQPRYSNRQQRYSNDQQRYSNDQQNQQKYSNDPQNHSNDQQKYSNDQQNQEKYSNDQQNQQKYSNDPQNQQRYSNNQQNPNFRRREYQNRNYNNQQKRDYDDFAQKIDIKPQNAPNLPENPVYRIVPIQNSDNFPPKPSKFDQKDDGISSSDSERDNKQHTSSSFSTKKRKRYSRSPSLSSSSSPETSSPPPAKRQKFDDDNYYNNKNISSNNNDAEETTYSGYGKNYSSRKYEKKE